MAGYEDRKDEWTASTGTWDGSQWSSVESGGLHYIVILPNAPTVVSAALRVKFSGVSSLLLTALVDFAGVPVTITSLVGFSVGSGDINLITFVGTAAFVVSELGFYDEDYYDEPSETINMARFIYQGVIRDGAGNVVSGATVSVYLAGTTTAASVYATSTGGAAINSTTTSTSGKYSFHVDNDDYAADQRFKIVSSKTGYQSDTWDNLVIFPYIRTVTA